ncbi:MAG: DUF362 domain-containing protein, partial [Planctomycetes bacterium]|nr:DUF362 domain-containing protein [Planctomycetota bacterium]
MLLTSGGSNRDLWLCHGTVYVLMLKSMMDPGWAKLDKNRLKALIWKSFTDVIPLDDFQRHQGKCTMVVAVKRVEDDVIEAVAAAMDAASFQDYIPRHSRVFLKVNLGWDLFIPGSVTNPAVFLGVVRKLKGYAKEIYVVESDQVLENIEKAYFKSKISEIAKQEGVEWVNLSKGDRIIKSPPGNKVIKEVPIPKVLT